MRGGSGLRRENEELTALLTIQLRAGNLNDDLNAAINLKNEGLRLFVNPDYNRP